MSDDSPSHSEVTSKYFANKPGMDESLSEFQEEKKRHKGPKDLIKSKTVTQKSKKRLRGQKDIRTALKPKKNELYTYANDFDKVCKESGIDVDPEQLQLAIALSKSLQNDTEYEESTSSNIKDKTVKIRRTLQEYGFKVPILKSIVNTKRKVKKYRKDYKLISSSVEEKHQIISDRYTQVLFSHIESKILTEKVQNNKLNLYKKATHTTYKEIRRDNCFYINNLIEVNSNTLGNLLKNWSDIPGRPVSPEPEKSEVKFREFECTQDELDIILSGTVNAVQEMVKTLDRVHIELQESEEKDPQYNKMDIEDPVLSLDDENGLKTRKSNVTKEYEILEARFEEPVYISTQNLARSCSPDIFDDEISSIMEKTKDNSICTSQEAPKNITDANNILMDITECVDVNSQRNTTFNHSKSLKICSQLSQGSNLTKRRSNDFMEITDCVAISSQPLLENIVEENIDLTQNSDDKSTADINKDKSKKRDEEIANECVDLTQDTDKTLTNNNEKKDVHSLDLTQSSNSDEELPMVQISGKVKTTKEVSLHDTVIVNDDEFKDLNAASKETSFIVNQDLNEILTENTTELLDCSPKGNQDDAVNSTVSNEQETTSSSKENETDDKGNNFSITTEDIQRKNTLQSPRSCSKSKSDTFFDQFVHTHSDEDDKEEISVHNKESIIEVEEDNNCDKSQTKIDENIDNNIDLTQSSNTSDENSSSSQKHERIKNTEVSESSQRQDENHMNQEVDLQSSDSSKEEDYLKNNYRLEISEISDCNEIQSGRNDIHDDYYNNDIDLTQSSNDEEDSKSLENEMQVSRENLGRKDNVSIDYDELFDNFIEKPSIHSKHSSMSSKSSLEYKMDISKSTTDHEKDSKSDSNSNNFERSNSILSSHNSDVFEISDNELNYSINRSKYEREEDNFDFGGISIMNELSNARHSKSARISEVILNNHGISINPRHTKSTLGNQTMDESYLPLVEIGASKTKPNPKDKDQVTTTNLELKTNAKSTPYILSKANSIQTPSNVYVIKTDQVTPMLDYDAMTTPERNMHLDKYGLKPFKRKRAIQLLKHLYNQTHPILESCSNEDQCSPSKKRKKDASPQKSPRKNSTQRSPRKNVAQGPLQKNINFNDIQEYSQDITRRNLIQDPQLSEKNATQESSKNIATQKSPKNNVQKSPRKKSSYETGLDNDANSSEENYELYETTNECPVMKTLECIEEDWVFQKKEKAKLHSCRVPLHIAFHNYMSARPGLLEAILRYEPVNIDDIHKGLVQNGLRFDPKDLLKFMDKKCITVKTADCNNKKQHS